jgi:Flp pilus assembly protein TadD
MFPQFPKQGRNKRLVVTSLSSAVLLVCLCSCQTTQPDITGSLGDTGPAASHSDPKGDSKGDPRGDINAYRDRFRANPKDPDTALSYAKALRAAGERAQAVAVLEQATIANPKNKVLLAGYGRALADNGNFEQAFDVLSQAHSPEDPDWRILSVQGAVLDQQGKFEEARQYYASALRIAPDEPSVLSNLGLSYMLTRELPKAEATLRQAYANPNADARVRQNLALVIGLQGRFAEAEEIVKADLPPDEAAANVAYLKEMLRAKDGQRGGRGVPMAALSQPE